MGIPETYAATGAFFEHLGIAPHSMFPDAPPLPDVPPKVGVCTIIFDESGRLLLEQRSDCGWWCLPGGKLDAGETLEHAAIRETFEETGLHAEPTGFLGVFSDPARRTVCYPDNGDLRHLVDAAILAKVVGGTLCPSRESLDLAWFSPANLPLNTVPAVIEMIRHAIGWDGRPLLR